MPEVRTPLPRLEEGSAYVAGPEEYLIQEHHTLADVLRWVIAQSDIDEAEALLGRIKDERLD